MQPDGYVSVLVGSPAAICDSVHALPQAQDHGSVLLPVAASESLPVLFESPTHNPGNKEEHFPAEVGALKGKEVPSNAEPQSLQ